MRYSLDSDVPCGLFTGDSLLSYVQLQKSLKQHRDPPVNVLTNQLVQTDSSEFNNQREARLLQKDLPVNFHSISPNYYLCNAYHTYCKGFGLAVALEIPGR
jgi:hypothetical protein